jgi:predicted phage tail protein
MVRDVFLYGVAGHTFGRHFRLDVVSPAEAVRALITLRPGLRTLMRQGWWRVVVGQPHVRNTIGLDLLDMNLGGQPLHLVPATEPRGGDSSVGKIVLGVVLIGASIVTAGIASGGFAAGFGAAMGTSVIGSAGMGITFGNIAMLGVSFLLGGVSGLLTSSPSMGTGDAGYTGNARPEDSPSFLFNGVTNNSQQGGPVPLVYGTHLVGSIVINGGLTAEDIAV